MRYLWSTVLYLRHSQYFPLQTKNTANFSGAKRWGNATAFSPHNVSVQCASNGVPQHIYVNSQSRDLWSRDYRPTDHVIRVWHFGHVHFHVRLGPYVTAHAWYTDVLMWSYVAQTHSLTQLRMHARTLSRHLEGQKCYRIEYTEAHIYNPVKVERGALVSLFHCSAKHC